MSLNLCAVHHTHQDEPESFDEHHVVPLSWKPKHTWKVTLCPNAHRDIHVLIDHMVSGVTPEVERFPRGALELALRAMHEAEEQGLETRRTL